MNSASLHIPAGVVEERKLTVFSLRVSPKATADAITDLAKSLPMALPSKPNIFAGDAACSIAHVEPRAWLLIGNELPQLAEVGQGWIATDVSARYAVLRLSGVHIAELLSRAVAIVPGPCCIVRTLFADTMAVVIQAFPGGEFRLMVSAPAADFVAKWIRDAAEMAV